MPSTSFLLTIGGSLFLLHAAYSCLHYRNLISEFDWPVDEPAPALPPVDVAIEVAVGFFLLLTGQIQAVGPLRPVTSKGTKYPTRQAPSYRSRDFDLYTTRAGAMGM